MIKLRFLIPLILLLVLPGCIKNEMTITFDLPEDVNTSCRIVYYASTKKQGMVREAYVQINAGKGEMKLPQGYPSVMYIFASSSKTPSAIIYAERGDHMIVTGKGSDISAWEIKGNDVTDALSAWRIKNKGIVMGNDVDKLNAAVARYVNDNPNSDSSAIILYVYYIRRGHENEFTALEAKLSKKVLGNKKLMNALSAADLLTGAVEAPKYPHMIVLAGEEGYADTLELGKGSATFLMIRGKNGSEEVPADSLKSFVAGMNGKVLAELYADTDSLNWRTHIANDSIAGLKRLWLPLGLADSIAIEMGIKRIPYYIVIDSKGKALYRGDSFIDASIKFKNLTP